MQADAIRLPLADQSVDLVIGSPLYVDARLYLEGGRDLGVSRKCNEWISWMLPVTAECLRVSRGAVIWVMAGVTRDRNYQPGPEGLLFRWFAEGWGERGAGTHDAGSAYRPCYWHRSSIPGSGGDQWYRADVEYAMCFKRPGVLPWARPTENGSKPKFGPGGEFSNRLASGRRANDFAWGNPSRGKDGEYRRRASPAHRRYEAEGLIANPGTLLSTGSAGGGHLGHDLAHLNEAPYPEAVPRFFIRSHCPPDGLVLDPFGGSGTTAAAALLEGRRSVLCDLRRSQCDLSRRRLAPGDRYGIRDNPALAAPRGLAPLAGQIEMFD